MKQSIQLLLGTLLATIGIVAAALTFHLIPEPHISDNIDTSAFRDSCEVLFLGPSYVHAQIRPKIFDEETKRLGKPIRSCVLGKNGLQGYEQKLELLKILDERWPRLRMIFIDISLGDQKTAIPRENRFKPRVVRWHNRESVSWLLARLRRGEANLKKLNDLLIHVGHWAVNALRIGQGAEHLATMVVAPKKPSDRGYTPHTQKFVDAKIRKLLKTSLRGPDRAGVQWASELVATCQKAQRECHILISPTWNGVNVPSSPERGVFVHAYNDPNRYPQLYTLAARGNTDHISVEAKTTYTQLLAQDVVRTITGPMDSTH